MGVSNPCAQSKRHPADVDFQLQLSIHGQGRKEQRNHKGTEQRGLSCVVLAEYDVVHCQPTVTLQIAVYHYKYKYKCKYKYNGRGVGRI